MKATRLNGVLPLLACLALAGCWGDGSSSGTDAGGSTPPPADNGTPPPAANSPPTISGRPATSATVGRTWSFQPSIADPDGDALRVTADNLPTWISLDSSTGAMQGTPQAGDVLTWSDIRVTVTDGIASASLPEFTIVVSSQSAQTGTATLSWSAPTERADGSPIGQLAGYEVLYGQISRNYDTVIEINNAGVTRYVIEGLGPGTWYFAVKAVTTDGLESAPSQEVSKTI
jgi:hypothetical protein